MYTLNYRIDPLRDSTLSEVPGGRKPENDADFMRGRQFDFGKKFLPDGLSRIREAGFLNEQEQRLLSQVQARSFVNLSRLLKKFFSAKLQDISYERRHAERTVLQTLSNFRRDELALEKMFRHGESLAAKGMPAGYLFLPEADEIAAGLLGMTTWAAWSLTALMQATTQGHYMQCLGQEDELCDLYRDMLVNHWQTISRYIALGEDEWRQTHRGLSAMQREQAVNDLIAMLDILDGTIQAQAETDAIYFLVSCGRIFRDNQAQQVCDVVLRAYRWQFILSGMQEVRFLTVLGSLISDAQGERIYRALAPIMDY